MMSSVLEFSMNYYHQVTITSQIQLNLLEFEQIFILEFLTSFQMIVCWMNKVKVNLTFLMSLVNLNACCPSIGAYLTLYKLIELINFHVVMIYYLILFLFKFILYSFQPIIMAFHLLLTLQGGLRFQSTLIFYQDFQIIFQNYYLNLIDNDL